MASSQTLAKVLRVGVIRDGVLEHEQFMAPGQSVTLGTAQENTLVFEGAGLSEPTFTLFENHKGRYALQVTAAMRGKLSMAGGVVSLRSLCTPETATAGGSLWQIPLTEHDRGKLRIGNLTVLFQFVPPPVSAPATQPSFRSPWIEEDDPIFYGFFVLFSTLAVLLSIFVTLAPAPPELSIQEIGDRFAVVMQRQQQREEVIPEVPIEDPTAAAESETETASGGEPKGDGSEAKEPRTEVERAQATAARKEALRSRVKIARIGTRGKSTGGSTSAAFGGEGEVLSQLDGLSGGGVATDAGGTGTGALLRTTEVGTEDARIGDLKGGQVGTSEAAKVAAVDMSRYDVKAETGDVTSVAAGAEGVESVVRSKAGQLNYCYELQLKGDPSLGGRIQLEWNISGGRVTTASVVSNTTGNQALADCIIKKIRRWRFSKEADGIVSWPFVFRKR